MVPFTDDASDTWNQTPLRLVRLEAAFRNKPGGSEAGWFHARSNSRGARRCVAMNREIGGTVQRYDPSVGSLSTHGGSDSQSAG